MPKTSEKSFDVIYECLKTIEKELGKIKKENSSVLSGADLTTLGNITVDEGDLTMDVHKLEKEIQSHYK